MSRTRSALSFCLPATTVSVHSFGTVGTSLLFTTQTRRKTYRSTLYRLKSGSSEAKILSSHTSRISMVICAQFHNLFQHQSTPALMAFALINPQTSRASGIAYTTTLCSMMSAPYHRAWLANTHLGRFAEKY